MSAKAQSATWGGLVLFLSLVSSRHGGAQACVQPPADLVSWWSGDTDASDIQGNNDGVLEPGASAGVPGLVDGAFLFEGSTSNGAVDLGDVPAFDFQQSSSFTIDAWVNSFGSLPPGEDSQFIVSLNYGCVASKTAQVLALQDNQGPNTGRVFFLVRDALNNRSDVFGPVLLPNRWHHVAAVREVNGITKTLRLYVDGVLVGTEPDITTGVLAYTVNDFIGRRRVCGTFDPFNGLIDEVEIFSRALSDAEIQAIYNAGGAGKCKAVTPMTCNGFTGTIIGTDESDIIAGSQGVDVILGRGGNDRIDGRPGSDVICGGPGFDVLFGGDGADQLFGQVGNDGLSGDEGNDVLDGGNGYDTVEGGSGADVLRGGAHNDKLFGQEGNDRLLGGPGDDVLNGGVGSDRCNGGTHFVEDSTVNCEAISGVP